MRNGLKVHDKSSHASHFLLSFLSLSIQKEFGTEPWMEGGTRESEPQVTLAFCPGLLLDHDWGMCTPAEHRRLARRAAEVESEAWESQDSRQRANAREGLQMSVLSSLAVSDGIGMHMCRTKLGRSNQRKRV